MITYLAFIAGLISLLIAGDLLVRGSVSIAQRLNIPALIIGLTIVAFGTSAPELFVSIKAALSDAPGIAVGNVVGSNIANIWLVLGVSTFLCATNCEQPYVRRNLFFVLAVTLLFIYMSFQGTLTHLHGIILFSILVFYLVSAARRCRKISNTDDPECPKCPTMEMIEEADVPPDSWPKTSLYLIAGLVGLPLGADLVVNHGSEIARHFGVSEAVIGLSLIAFGTSLPELATSLIAARRGHCGLAIGNILGSNLFNILAVMGITAMITPVEIPEHVLKFDLWIMLAALLTLAPFILKKSTIGKFTGIGFLTLFFAYIVFLYIPHG